ncbi:uncharacterized protein LOC106641211 [Copidosoma floridanum]|uniref:uncharacterized protein LOC106641211 n=1 Tax=Copidosoma floridanum TaxID=29053 RepID=UPI0006C98815|nr:uncharacterized protein LOC106641211 [Copidosoma floridanum]
MLNFYRRCILGAANTLAPLNDLLKELSPKKKKAPLSDHKLFVVYAARQPSNKASPWQVRHLDYILQHQVTLCHVKGEDNVVADALSRINTIAMPSVIDPEVISKAQAEDQELEHLFLDPRIDLQPLTIDGHLIHCETSTGVVRPYLPKKLRRTSFEVLHNLSHPSMRATARLVAQKFRGGPSAHLSILTPWPKLRKGVTQWVQQCEPCQRSKVHHHNRSALGDFDIPNGRFDHIHVDLRKLPLTKGYQYCLTIIGRFSKWPVKVSIPDQQASTVTKALIDNWISNFGTLLTLTSDQGAQFDSTLFTELNKMIDTNRIRTMTYHPQSNGMVERVHRTLKAGLMCNEDTPWPDALTLVLLGLRKSFKEDLQSFILGLRQLQQAIKRPSSHVFKHVDAIRKPLDPPYTGPHKVIRRINDQSFIIEVNGRPRTGSTDTLKPAYLERSDMPSSGQADAAVPLPATGPHPGPNYM